MSTFTAVEGVWSARLDNLRNTVRQHVIASQLADHLEGVRTALDVGCGQGTQALRLAARGLDVTGVDPSEELLGRLREDARAAGVAVRTGVGTVEQMPDEVAGTTYDLVCGHGVLMYLDDAAHAVHRLAGRVAPGGRLSFTVRNGDALAYRPGVRGRWVQARAAFDATTYVNELGAPARAHCLEEALSWCEDAGMSVESWYGVRVFTDGREADEMPDPETLQDCLAAEVEAGRRDPYRRIASQLHVVARA